MNIIEANTKIMIAFSDLIGGALFRNDEEYYLATEDVSGHNAVNIRTGEMTYFNDEDEVETLPNAKLIV